MLAQLRLTLAEVRSELAHAKARAERLSIATAGGDIGKNDTERQRNLVIALAESTEYVHALTHMRWCEAQIGEIEAQIANAEDDRRQREWAIRERLVNALLAQHAEPDKDAAFDVALNRSAFRRNVPTYLEDAELPF